MAITATDKIKINKYIKEHALDEIYYLDLCNALCKKQKISDIEFLEYFTDCVVSEFHKEDKISLKYLEKLLFIIDMFLNFIHETNIEITEKTLDKIRSFKDFYMNYLNKNGYDLDFEFNNNCIEVVLKTINELYPCEKSNESITKYISQVTQLETQINILKKQLEEITRIYDNLKNSSNQKTAKMESLNRELQTCRKRDENNQERMHNLNETIIFLNDRINALEALLSQAYKENKILVVYQEQCKTLASEVAELKKKIEEERKEKETFANLKIKQTEIEALIYQKLLSKNASLDAIVKYIEDKGFTTDRDEIVSLLRRMKEKVHIDNSFSLQCPTYKIGSPNFLQDSQFSINIPNGLNMYDIMLVSDLHLKDFDCETLKGLDILNDYCVQNNIHLILDLGDFYQGDSNLNYKKATESYQLIEKTISSFPKANGLYHAVLGGNHDKFIFKYGFDPIKILSEEREDFINLGYTHATISLNDNHNTLGTFDIHHPDKSRFPLSLNAILENKEHLENYLNSIYSKQDRNRDDSYIDIFGHMHKSQLNCYDSYCYIPNFFDLQKGLSAYHLRIYFDENTKIKYMVFMPLTLKQKLIKNNEIIYQKALKR